MPRRHLSRSRPASFDSRSIGNYRNIVPDSSKRLGSRSHSKRKRRSSESSSLMPDTTPIIRSLRKGVQPCSVAPLLSARAKRIANKMVSRRSHLSSIHGFCDGYRLTVISVPSRKSSQNSARRTNKATKEVNRRKVVWVRGGDGRLRRKAMSSDPVEISRWAVHIANAIRARDASRCYSSSVDSDFHDDKFFIFQSSNIKKSSHSSSSSRKRSKSADYAHRI